jgi:hypothetical protein
MVIVEMAKAHLQNVHNRVEELQKQKNIIEDEIQKLSSYIAKGLEEIEQHESAENVEVNVSNK